MIPLFKPSMGEDEVNAVREVIESGWIGLGPKTEEFERLFAEYVGSKYAVGTNSATAALHLAVKVLGLPRGSDILTSPMTFISTAMAASYNDLNPVFVDIEPDTLNMDANDLKQKITKKTRAVLPVHFGGHPCDMDAIRDFASDNNLVVLDDCAHATGSQYKGRMVGTLAAMSCFSFHAVKNLATADGGMITTANKDYYEHVKRLRWVGIDKSTYARAKSSAYKWDYDVVELGYKYHPNDILSAIGIVQLRKIEKTNARRREIFRMYNEAFSSIGWMETPVHREGIVSACHNYVAKVPDREALIAHLNNSGISGGVHYKPAYLHPIYRDVRADCPVTDSVWKRLITLPVFPDLADEQVSLIIKAVRGFSPKGRTS
ncbi:DegT/DnrJ/EryC1/StrS aminotransferase family protein [Candidatus Woesearchaeota archaeon]|nr:DegT/DnrJ/EryC1/StrS aminotransferase family protein [Candidatus Woesearchaeota archaeon]